VSYHNFK